MNDPLAESPGICDAFLKHGIRMKGPLQISLRITNRPTERCTVGCIDSDASEISSRATDHVVLNAAEA